MRGLMAVILGVLSVFAHAQKGAPTSLFLTVRPQAMIVVQRHPLGPDVVEITIPDGGYPVDQLKRQIEAIGRYVGEPARSVNVYSYPIGGGSEPAVRATFSVLHLISPDMSQVRVAPIVKGLTGAPAPHTLSGLDIMFRDVAAGPAILQDFHSADGKVAVEAMSAGNPPGVEYRVSTSTQDPGQITIPDAMGVEADVHPKLPPPPPASTDWPLISIFAVAACAGGALVYSYLLRARPRSNATRPKNPRRP